MSGRFAVIPIHVLDEPRLTMSHLRVLVALGSHCDKFGWAYPASTKISAMVGLSPGRVRSCLVDLESFGMVQTHARFRDDGGRKSNHYRVIMDLAVPPVGTSEPEEAHQPPPVTPVCHTDGPVSTANGPRLPQEQTAPVCPKGKRPPSALGANGYEGTNVTTQGNEPTNTPQTPTAVVGARKLGFDDFWAAYAPAKHRRTDKPRCMKLWASKGLDAVAGSVIAHVQACCASHSWQSGFAPMSATYLSQERYNDDPPPAEADDAGAGGSFYGSEQAAKQARAAEFTGGGPSLNPRPVSMLKRGPDGVMGVEDGRH